MTIPNKPIAKGEEEIRTGKGIALWPKLFTKDEMSECYVVELILTPDVAKDTAAKVKKFGTDAFKGNFPKGLAWCLRKGDDWLAGKSEEWIERNEDVVEAVKGNFMLRAKAPKYQPRVGKIDGGQPRAIEFDEQSEIYSGCVGAVMGTLAAYNGKYPAVTFRISSFVKFRDGERLGGSGADWSAYKDLVDEADESIGSEGASNDLDDEIPF